MRMLLSLVGLLVVLGVVMWLARGATDVKLSSHATTGMPGAVSAQSPQQVPQQYKEVLERAMQQARPIAEEP